MASGGGGAWKVAYADFVTAMMAFFLVMWLVGQDQDKKEAITRYFNNPLGIRPIKDSKTPDSKGALFNSTNNGEVPGSQAVMAGMGRKSYSENNEASPSTKLIGDHLFADDENVEYWQEEARKDLKQAKRENPGNPREAERAAIKRISSKIKSDVVRDLPEKVPQVYRDLIFESLNSVNWEELAEDVVEQADE